MTERGSSAVAFGSREGGERDAVFLFFEQLYFHFGVFETRFANFEELVALFVFRQKVGQRHVAGFHGVNDGFELSEGVFEGESFVGLGFHAPNLRGWGSFSTKLWKRHEVGHGIGVMGKVLRWPRAGSRCTVMAWF